MNFLAFANVQHYFGATENVTVFMNVTFGFGVFCVRVLLIQNEVYLLVIQETHWVGGARCGFVAGDMGAARTVRRFWAHLCFGFSPPVQRSVVFSFGRLANLPAAGTNAIVETMGVCSFER